MTIIDTVKRLLGVGPEPESVHLYSCTDCGNVFTTTTGSTAEPVTCPNCDSTNVELTVE